MMGSYSFSSYRICRSLIFLLLGFFCRTYGGTCAKISYNDHCGSVAPESSSTVRALVDDLQFLEKSTSYYTGGEEIFPKISSSADRYRSNYSCSLTFYATRNVYETNTPGVYKVEAYLKFHSPFYGSGNYSTFNLYTNSSRFSSHRRRRRGQLVFLFNGFWSNYTRKLCMVGSASGQQENGRLVEFQAVLNLKYGPDKSTIFTSIVNGRLKSLSTPKDSTYFHPVKIVSFPFIRSYNFTLVSEPEEDPSGGGINVQSLDLNSRRICSYFYVGTQDFVLDYDPGCYTDSNNCSPLKIKGDVAAYLPRMVSLSITQCFEEEEKVRYMIRFSNNSYSSYEYLLDPETTLIGEGSWERKKNQMNIVACRIINPPSTSSFGDASVGDCSIRMSLIIPSVLTINSTGLMIGGLWTNNSVNSNGYFKKIMYRSLGDYDSWRFPGLKYEFTELTKTRESCSVKEPATVSGGGTGNKYPNGNSNEMRFQISIKYSGEEVGWGDAKPIAVGDELHRGNTLIVSEFEEEGGHSDVIGEGERNTTSVSLMNISYNIILNILLFKTQFSSLNYSQNPKGSLEINAEGVYDAERGLICMVGCRQLYPYNNQNSFRQSLDCDILVNLEFPTPDSRYNSYIEGIIQSKRPKSDPLYFDRLNISSFYYPVAQAQESIWRMDLEIIMVLVTNSLACIFVALQILHVKKNPGMIPFISIAMLTILTLGHFIPLVLNFEALILKNQYQRNVIFRGSGLLEVNEMSVRLVTMVAFLLLCRLLQLALADGNANHSWKSEKRVLFFLLPLYIAGGLITILASLKKKNDHGNHQLVLNSNTTDYYQPALDLQQESVTLVYLRSYSGLIVDGFLLPQILLNMFQDSKQSSLSKPFYLGTTLVRFLPHGYDLYRINNFFHRDFDGSYIYANPNADFYSIAWDAIILGGCILFAVIIWLQQRFGGRCVIPGKLKELEL